MVANFFSRLLGLFTGGDKAPPIEDVSSTVDALTAIFDNNVTLLANGLSAGTVTLGQFDGALRSEIRKQQLAVAVAAAGGADHATPDVYQIAQQQVDEQLKFFDAWMVQLREQAARGQLPSAAQLAARAKLYGASARGTEQRVTTKAQGVPTLPFYPRDGKTKCRANCCCEWRILPLRGNGNYDCFWILDPECDHCPQCGARRRAASPLRVRNGAIMDAEKYQAAALYT